MVRKTRLPSGGHVAAIRRVVRGADASTTEAAVMWNRRANGARVILQVEEDCPRCPTGSRRTGSALRRHYSSFGHVAALFGVARRDLIAVAKSLYHLAARAGVVIDGRIALPTTARALLSLLRDYALVSVSQPDAVAEDDALLITEASAVDAPMEDADAAAIARIEATVAAILPAPRESSVVGRLVSAVTVFAAKAADRIGNLVSKVGYIFGRRDATEASA